MKAEMLKIKEFDLFAFSAWSPVASDSVYLASVSAAYENPVSGVSGRTSPPVLELFCPNFSSPQLEMRPQIGIEVDSRATCLCWTCSGAQSHLGLLIAGDAVGSLTVYDPGPLVDRMKLDQQSVYSDVNHVLNDADLIDQVKCFTRESAHAGFVRSIDSNRFQANLFASAADEGEIFIWDIEKMDQPMIPSTRTQPFEDISTVAWNPRVQHILATASAGSCVIWDLRKSESVVHLTKTMCQFEPHLMAWSPDIATRLCLADPAHPTADIQLWDLRYPKHMLALLGRWPPSPSLDLHSTASGLGNAGNVNALAWSPSPQIVKSRPALTLHDADLIAVFLTASGALSTSSGACGSGLEPTSADFLVVWSVNEALKCVQAESVSGHPSNTRNPVFVGRLEGGGEGEGTNTTSDGLPSTSAVHWLPSNPGLISVTQSDGWIGIYNLNAGVLGDATTSTRVLRSSSRRNTRSRLGSNKVAEAFAELEIDLHDSTQKGEADLLNQSIGDTHQNDTVGDVSATRAQLSHQLPQPMPRLRIAPRWNKRPCGVSFGFGGRLVSFLGSNDLSLRPRSSASLCVSRQASSVPGEITAPGTEATQASNVPTTEVSSPVRSVQLDLVDSLNTHPIRGMKFALKCMSEEELHTVVQNMLHWLDQILTVPLDRLPEICDRMAEICVPNLVCCNSNWLSPWELLKIQFQPTTEKRKLFSSSLGFCEQHVHKEIESVLEQTSDAMDAEFNCPCRMGTSRDIAIENLSALRLALVTNNLESTIHLCMQSSFAALSCPGLSALSSIALLLAHQYQTPESYGILHSIIVDRLQQVHDLSGTEGTYLRTVISILMGLFKHDWSPIISEWPLEDWSTAVALLVNYVWVADVTLFRQLCGILINRLLDPLSETSLTTEVKGAAAWATSVISADLNGLIRAWCWLCDAGGTEYGGGALLALTMQICLLARAMGCTQTVGRLTLDSTTSSPDVLTVTQVLSLVAEWLGQIGARHSGSEALSGLRLLRLAMDTTTPEINESAHRIWCSLTDDQRACASVKFESPFYCPFVKPGARTIQCRCPCGIGQHQQQRPIVANRPAHCGYPPQPVQYGAHLVPPVTARAPLFTSPPTGPFVSEVLKPPLPPVSTHQPPTPLIPRSTQNGPVPQCALPLKTSLPPGPHVRHGDPNLGYPPTMTNPAPLITPPIPRSAAGLDRAWTPGTKNPPPSALSNYAPLPAVSVPATGALPMPGSHVCPQFPSVASTQGKPNSMLPTGQMFLDSSASLPTSQSNVGGAWNDPPFLAKTYKPPVRPVIPTNQFYDPTQFSPSAVQPPMQVGATPLGSTTNISTGALPPPDAPGSFPNWDSKLVNTSVSTPPLPPLLTTGLPPPNAGLGRPPPNVPTSQSITSSTVFKSPVPPIPTPSALRSPFEQLVHFTNESQSQPFPPLLPSQRPRSTLDVNQWPAAQPLASTMLPPESTTTNSSETLSGPTEKEPVPPVHPVTAEYEAVETTLQKLVQLCRNCGGKPYATKMDTVDRRLQTLFTALRGGPGAHLMSDQIVHHLLDCVHSADSGDYGAAVGHANLLIQSATGFESIHGFAPGLKILMQSAKQLFPNQTTPPDEHLGSNQRTWPQAPAMTGMR